MPNTPVDQLVEFALTEMRLKCARGVAAAIKGMEERREAGLPDPPPEIMAMIGRADPHAIIRAYVAWLDANAS